MKLDAARAACRTPEQIAAEGAIFDINGGAVFTGNGALMRFIVWPGAGCRMLGGHLALHPPGVSFRPHVHPISEDAIFTLQGHGDAFLVDKWIEVGPGDIIYAPAGVEHGTANRKGRESTYIAHGYAGPPQFDLYEWAGYFKHGRFDQEAVKQGSSAPGSRDLELEDAFQLDGIPGWGGERAETKTPDQIRKSGAIFNINGGVSCRHFGPLTRFVLAPFTGAQLISVTVVIHQPGEIFQPHTHLVSDDATLIVKGHGEAYLGGTWSAIKPGDILYAPPGVEHGTRNMPGSSDLLVSVSFACPPPFDLYSRAGLLVNGRFVLD
jgi:quercetin dioxygenase-like cupin family protein